MRDLDWSSTAFVLNRKGKLVPLVWLYAALLFGCATQKTQIEVTESGAASREEQRAAQEAIRAETPAEPTLKRKLAIGRFSNETRYGQTFWRDREYDPLGKQAADMLTARLVNTNRFMVFERPDLNKLEREQAILGESNLVGVETLILGSITEFGRSTTGETGFLSSTKLQTARAVVEIRLVDARTGYAFFSADGQGEASLESGDIAGFGSKAEYDATLNDRAIAAAVADVIEELLNELEKTVWRTDILSYEDSLLYISGGKRQGLQIGSRLVVMQPGKKIKSRQTGFDIDLPSTEVAEIEVTSFFGDSEINEGSVAVIESGSIPANISGLYVTEKAE
jgi:curli biogenesis system outer membrane secretion channel CsgG